MKRMENCRTGFSIYGIQWKLHFRAHYLNKHSLRSVSRGVHYPHHTKCNPPAGGVMSVFSTSLFLIKPMHRISACSRTWVGSISGFSQGNSQLACRYLDSQSWNLPGKCRRFSTTVLFTNPGWILSKLPVSLWGLLDPARHGSARFANKFAQPNFRRDVLV